MKRTLLLLLCSGCSLSPDVPSFVPGLTVICGVAAVGVAEPPAPPSPDGPCDSCGGQGWLGDGRIKFDCPDCDLDPVLSEPPAPPLTAGQSDGHHQAGMEAAVPAEPKPRIDWLVSMAEAQRLSVETGKPILLHTWFDGCGDCVVLDRTCLSDPTVVDAVTAACVPLKVDLLLKRDDGKTGAQALREGLQLQRSVAAPADVLLDSEGRPLSPLVECAYDQPADYLAHLQELLK